MSGETPFTLVKLARLMPQAQLYILRDSPNLLDSLSYRLACNMLDGVALQPDQSLLLPIDDERGIAFAIAAAERFIALTLMMPASISDELHQLVESLAIPLILTPSLLGIKGAIEKAAALMESDSERFVLLNPYDHPSNVQCHESITAPFLWEALQGQVDMLVGGLNTGGAITGVSRYFQAHSPQPVTAVVTTLTAKEVLSGGIETLDFVPANLDLNSINRLQWVSTTEAFDVMQRMQAEEGMSLSLQACGRIAAAMQLLKPEQCAVVLLPAAIEQLTTSIPRKQSVHDESVEL